MTHLNAAPPHRPICDYEGSGYKDDFWTGKGREYEDLAERIALAKLLPGRGRRLLEIGAGFGRLAGLYRGYDEVVLLDYSSSLLHQAQANEGHDPRFTFVAADLYDLPFTDGQFDAIVMVRVMHHIVDVPAVLQRIRPTLAAGGTFILEFANKRNLKSIIRYVLRQQTWNPFAAQPYEFVPLNFDFHPAWMKAQLRQAGFRIAEVRTLSHFRSAPLKRAFPHTLLARVDGWLQPTGSLWQLTPSVMIRATAAGSTPAASAGLFRCPGCGGVPLEQSPGQLTCKACGRGYVIRDGIYDFKEPTRG